MDTLITGGTGFIGSRLSSRLLAQGHAVRVLGLDRAGLEAENCRLLDEQGASVVVSSIDETRELDELVDGVDAVIHLAAVQHEMNVPDERFYKINVEGTRRLLSECAAAGVRRIVHGSTIGVYGLVEGTVDESTPSAPNNVYERSKLAAERAVGSEFSSLGVVIVRIPETYGPGDARLLKLFRAVDKGSFFMVGRGTNLHHPMYVDDLVEGILAATRAPEAAGETVLLGGPSPVSTRDMVAAVARAVGKDPPRLSLPMLPFSAAAVGLETVLRPLGIQPPLHSRRLDFFRKSLVLSTAKAARLLSFQPKIDFEEGARRTAAWYREAGWM